MRPVLPPFFSWAEAESRDGVPMTPEQEMSAAALLWDLHTLRASYGHTRPIRITNLYRSPALNRRVGGARRSQHLKAKAADIRVPGVSPRGVRRRVRALRRRGLMRPGGDGLYVRDRFNHLDHGRPRSWRGN